MAGCAGTGTGSRQLVLVAIAMLTAASIALAQTPAAPATQVADKRATLPADNSRPQRQPAQQGKAMPAKTDGPDAALIEYLGEFDDAADGLDAMGLSDPETPAGKSDGGGNR
jgi:hypothetical protein